jgi:hypothetical protein
MRRHLALACALLAGSCSGASQPAKSKTPETLSPPPESAPASQQAPGGKLQGDKRSVTFEARFDIDRLAGGKRFQGAMLYLDSGRVLVAGYRPIPRYFQFVDKRVRVTGRHYTPSPDVQHVSGDHFSIEKMQLAEGETPYDPKPTALPTPPTVTRGSELEPRNRRWVQLFAVLDAGRREKDDYWCDVVLKLSDGVLVSGSVYYLSFDNRWRPLMGQKVTVIGRVKMEGEQGQRRFSLEGPLSVCRGKVPRCGMEPISPRREPGGPPAP